MIRRYGMRSRSRVWLKGLLVMVFLVGGPILFVGKKVELDNLAQNMVRLEDRIETLQQERSLLTAVIVFKRKPGAIEQIARGRLDMEYTSGRLSNLTFESHPEDMLE